MVKISNTTWYGPPMPQKTITPQDFFDRFKPESVCASKKTPAEEIEDFLSEIVPEKKIPLDEVEKDINKNVPPFARGGCI